MYSLFVKLQTHQLCWFRRIFQISLRLSLPGSARRRSSQTCSYRWLFASSNQTAPLPHTVFPVETQTHTEQNNAWPLLQISIHEVKEQKSVWITLDSKWYNIDEAHTAQRRDPSFFHAKLVMVYRLTISLGLASSHAPLLGAQLNTRNLRGGGRRG